MTRVLPARFAAAIACGAVAAAALGLSIGQAQADETVQVLANEVAYEFADHIRFDLSAPSESPIVDATLRYQIGIDEPINRRVPQFQAGSTFEAWHTEDLSRGEIPPASLVTWWWTLTYENGDETATEEQSFRYLDQRFDWQSTGGDYVRVWWYDGDRAEAEEIAAEALDSFSRLEDLIGALPDRRIEIVVYASQDDMRPALVARGSTYESRLATLGARVAPDILLLDAGTRSEDLFEVLAHELSHIVLHLRFGNEYLNTASWLDEGLAMYIEGDLDKNEQLLLDEAIVRDQIMSVRSLTSFPGDAQLVPLAYAQSQDLVSFLIEGFGVATFNELIDVVSAGEVPTDDALEQVYGFDQLGMYQAYRDHYGLAAAATPEPGSAPRRPRRQSPSPSPCAATLLVLPAVALAHLRRRHA